MRGSWTSDSNINEDNNNSKNTINEDNNNSKNTINEDNNSYNSNYTINKDSNSLGGSPYHSGGVQALRPGGPGSNLGVSKIFSEIFLSLLDVAELIDSKDSAKKLNKLTEPIQYW